MPSTDLSSTGLFKQLRLADARALSGSCYLRARISALRHMGENTGLLYMSLQVMEKLNVFKLSWMQGMISIILQPGLGAMARH